MKDSNPSRLYLDDAKRRYVKAKSDLVNHVCDYRKLLNDYLVDRGDRVQYEVNEISQYHCEFRLINHVLVELSEDGVRYDLVGDVKPTTNQTDELKRKGSELHQLVLDVRDAKDAMKEGAENG